MIYLIGGKRLGEPGKTTKDRLNAITSLAEIESIARKLDEVKNWDKL